MNVDQNIRRLLLASLLLGFMACGPAEVESEQSEYAHMVGDFMSGFTDSLVSGGITTLSVHAPTPASSSPLPNGSPFTTPVAQPLSVDCSQVTIGSCVTTSGKGVQTRTYTSCSYNGFTFNGDVTYEHSGANCALNPATSVQRTPNYTVAGRRGNTLYVYGTDPVETITRSTATTYKFASNPLTRAFVDTSGNTVLEYESQTLADISIAENTSTHVRTITGGTIQVKNDTSGETCSLSPTNVTWDSSCNCPVSGYWSGSCGGPQVKIQFDGCAVADFSYTGSSSTTISLDHCF